MQLSNVSSSLYWSLPTPSSLLQRIAMNARNYRANVLSFQHRVMPGTWDAVRDGLSQADIRKIVDLGIGNGMDVASEIGPHFDASFLTPGQLAEVFSEEPVAVLLRPQGDQAFENCKEYFAQFLEVIEHTRGNVHLFIETRDGEQRADGEGSDVRVVAFDSALSSDEMSAYVGLRMLGRNGPGSTRLLRSLVFEYAGFDAELAELLIELSDSDILALPDALSPLLEAEPLRWRNASWADGTALAGGAGVRHPLHEWYLALHAGPKQEEARFAARKRYWRACVQALTPWLEERRLRVLDFFAKPLDAFLAPTGGKIHKPLPNGRTVIVDRCDIEYSNIVGLHYHQGLVIPSDSQSQQALAICKIAKVVRDDLAHIRTPSVQDILSLTTAMDTLLG